MILKYEDVEIDIGCAQYPSNPNRELAQVREKSGSGIVYIEDFNVQTNTNTYVFGDMSQENYEKLMEFFINTVSGMVKTFTLTDDQGNFSDVNFVTPQIPFQNTSFLLWAGKFTVEAKK